MCWVPQDDCTVSALAAEGVAGMHSAGVVDRRSEVGPGVWLVGQRSQMTECRDCSPCCRRCSCLMSLAGEILHQQLSLYKIMASISSVSYVAFRSVTQ